MAAEALNFKKVPKVIGIKQSVKAAEKNLISAVYVADDADFRLILPLQQICLAQKITVVGGHTMEELGVACGIDVGAAAIAILK
jgi:large subunit ribosomal protein L7A